MTSANKIEYTIFNKQGEEVGIHSQNIMCHICNDDLMKFIPASDFTIKAWGYDEEEDYWEDKEVNLEKWLLKNKATITFKKFNPGNILNIRKIGKCEVIEMFDIFKKGQNFFPIYTVKTDTNEIIDINQNQIIP